MTLSDTQTLILTTSAQHPESIATPPASLPPAPRAAVAKAMLRAGLLVAAGTEHNGSSAAWKLDGAMVILRITEAGLRAIGVEQRVMPAQADEAAQEAPATTMPENRHSESPPAAEDECVSAASQPADAARGASQAPHGALPRPSLRDAARNVPAVWDAPDRSDLATALEALRAALPARATAPRSTAPRLPRPETPSRRRCWPCCGGRRAPAAPP